MSGTRMELAELERARVARFDANQIKIPPYPGYTIDVKPFALEGAALEQWVQLLLDARLGAL